MLADTRGVVVVTTSGFAPGEREAFDEIRRRGVVVVTCFPSGDHASPTSAQGQRRGPAAEGTAAIAESSATDGQNEEGKGGGKEENEKEENEGKDEKGKEKEAQEDLPPVVRAQHLLPQKARILLMCALAVTGDAKGVQGLFAAY